MEFERLREIPKVIWKGTECASKTWKTVLVQQRSSPPQLLLGLNWGVWL